jgi:hypothetical protein
VIELGLPLIQERDDFVKLRLLPEKHLPHLLVVLSQSFQPVLWRPDAQGALDRCRRRSENGVNPPV